ncbi:kinase-like protein [Punctularia strigosozonata HHB-11173 SS5]|uniref:kinase-like protein n=1 Tax=Punctularia strigosozonata (strain HHB-11173) TaxID=741275 RepID=UPI0004416525|nr:kinase-like protein [Punctularia strigosozonata HHB-11173 SS5]EIN06915.1 kinase-like protein [Punctularia strigosozonata HHB-11173 SS5]
MTYETFGKFAHEIRLWEGFCHPNVLELLDWCTNPKRPTELSMITSVAPEQSLLHYVARYGKLPEYLAQPVVAQVIDGLMGFLHRDIKPENILVFHQDESGVLTVKIGDFGTCIRKKEDPNAPVDRAGSTNYAAPEVAMKRNNELSDAFCVGGVMYFILFKKRPFLVREGAKDVVDQITTRRSQLVELDEVAPNATEENAAEESARGVNAGGANAAEENGAKGENTGANDAGADDANGGSGNSNAPTEEAQATGNDDVKKGSLSKHARALLRGLLQEKPEDRMDLRRARESPWLQDCEQSEPCCCSSASSRSVITLHPSSPDTTFNPSSIVVVLAVAWRFRLWRKRCSSPEFSASRRTKSRSSWSGVDESAVDPLQPIAEDLERAETASQVLNAILEHVPVPPQNAAMDVDLVPEPAEEPGAAMTDTVPAASTLKAPPPRTRARTRARKNAGSSPAVPVRRSTRIHDKRAGTAVGAIAATHDAQVAPAVGKKGMLATTGQKRKLGAQVEKASKRQKMV